MTIEQTKTEAPTVNVDVAYQVDVGKYSKGRERGIFF